MLNRFCHLVAVGVVGFSLITVSPLVAQDSVLNQAVVHLSFDEEAGPALDTGKASQHPDNGALVNDPVRVASPFWNQSGKKALLLDAARKQLVQFGESAEVDRPDAVTVSCFALNLNEASDATYHGLFAKRVEPGGAPTNYGINFQASGDVLQVYVNDTAAYRVANFSVKGALGFRRLNYLTMVMEVGDAPDPDADTDKDDVRVALYVNGKPVKPTNMAPNMRVVENDAWFLDVQVSKLINDTPLTIGASHASIEHTSLLVDEFSIFAKALSASDVARLFVEVAGANAEQLAQQELQPPSVAVPAPVLQRLSAYGLKRGQATALALFGQNLQPDSAKVFVPEASLAAIVQPGSNPNQLNVQISVPADTPPGLYPLRIETAGGVSNAIGLAIDDLPNSAYVESSIEKPVALPVAVSGVIGGAQIMRVYFAGKAGQRFVADVESRRLGAGIEMDPVLELKTARGKPIKIVWDGASLNGDARIDVNLPSDGIYFVEMHDLQYRAPGNSPFRLKLGDLQLADAVFPATLARTADKASIELIGTSAQSRVLEISQHPGDVALTKLAHVRTDVGVTGPLPLLRLSDAVSVVESPVVNGQLQMVDATFAQNKHVPIAINGRISAANEQDKFVLNVTPGMTLSIIAEAQAIGSPLTPQLLVAGHPQGNGLAGAADRPGTRDPGLDFAVSAGVSQIQLHIKDLFGKGGSHFIYRLRIVPAGQPSFSLTTNTPAVTLAANGTSIVEVQLTRNGYAGPIVLKTFGDDGVKVTPDQLPPTAGNGKYFVTLTHAGAAAGLRTVRLVGESVDLAPPLRVVATNPANSRHFVSHQELLPVVVSGTSPLKLTSLQPPVTLFRGLPADIAVAVERTPNAPGANLPVLLRVVSNEEPRKQNPADPNPNAAQKPLVAAQPNQTIAAGAPSATLRLNVPVDVAQPTIQFVAKAEILPHAYSSQVIGQVFSAPFLLPVQNAATVTLDATKLTLEGGKANTLVGTVKRTAGFAGAIDVTLQGLPAGYTAPKVTVPADKEQFDLIVTAGPEAAAKDIPNITLRVEATGIGPILPDAPVALKVGPPK